MFDSDVLFVRTIKLLACFSGQLSKPSMHLKLFYMYEDVWVLPHFQRQWNYVKSLIFMNVSFLKTVTDVVLS